MAANLAVVLVTYNSGGVLAPCLDAIRDGPLSEVIVVDNGSTDDSVAVAQARGARTLVNRQNAGFARGANAGAARASAPLLCFLNPDCQPEPGLFARAADALADRPRRCVVPDLLEPSGTVVCGRQPGYTALKLIADVLETSYGVNVLTRWLRSRLRFHDRTWWWPHGACLFVHRTTFASLGGFDSRFFLYMEDVDFGLRMARAGGEVVHVAGIARHGQGRGARVSPRVRRRHLNTSRIAYGRLHHGRSIAALLAICAAPGEPLRRLLGRG